MDPDKMKFRLFVFDPIMFPRKLYIAIGGTKRDIEKLFNDRDDDPYQIADSEIDGSNCNVMPFVIYKKGNWKGVLVFIHTPERMDISTIAHEADHVANAIFNACGQGVDTSDDEIHAYLVGWAAKCIDEVLRKAKKNG